MAGGRTSGIERSRRQNNICRRSDAWEHHARTDCISLALLCKTRIRENSERSREEEKEERGSAAYAERKRKRETREALYNKRARTFRRLFALWFHRKPALPRRLLFQNSENEPRVHDRAATPVLRTWETRAARINETIIDTLDRPRGSTRQIFTRVKGTERAKSGDPGESRLGGNVELLSDSYKGATIARRGVDRW